MTDLLSWYLQSVAALIALVLKPVPCTNIWPTDDEDANFRADFTQYDKVGSLKTIGE